jgi:hypothetical protein
MSYLLDPRAMLEALGGDGLRHHSTLHENPAALLRDQIRPGEERSATGRLLRIGLAADALGADPPHWVRQDVRLEEDAPVQRFLDGLAPIVISDPPVPDAHPLHWCRPAPDWKDQRMRWIEPHWKGPDLAAVIERTYGLEP